MIFLGPFYLINLVLAVVSLSYEQETAALQDEGLRVSEFSGMFNLHTSVEGGGKYLLFPARKFELFLVERLLCFCFTTLGDWLAKLAPLSQPMRSKTRTSRDLLAHIFPRLAPVTCIFFEF